MKKLIPFKKIILIIGVVLTLILMAIQLIFGNGSGKIYNAIMMLVYPLFVFAFFRFALYMFLRKKAFGVVKFFSYFLFIVGAFFTIGGIGIAFVNFPNVASPAFSIGLSMIVCVLYINAKLDDTSNT